MTISIGNASIAQATTGPLTMPFTVTLSSPATSPVTVSYATVDLSAKAGIDYVAATGILTIPAGQTTGTINVTILSGPANQPSRFFGLTLSNPTNAILTTATGFGTILSPVGSVTMSIGNSSIIQSTTGTSTMPFTVTLQCKSRDLASHGLVRDCGPERESRYRLRGHQRNIDHSSRSDDGHHQCDDPEWTGEPIRQIFRIDTFRTSTNATLTTATGISARFFPQRHR